MIRFSFLYFPRFLLFTRISTVCNRRAIISIISHSLVYTKFIDSTRRHDVIEKMPFNDLFSHDIFVIRPPLWKWFDTRRFRWSGWSETCFTFIVKVIRISRCYTILCDIVLKPVQFSLLHTHVYTFSFLWIGIDQS